MIGHTLFFPASSLYVGNLVRVCHEDEAMCVEMVRVHDAEVYCGTLLLRR